MKRIIIYAGIALALALTLGVAAGSRSGDGPPDPKVAGNPPTADGWTMPLPDQGYNVREGRAIFLHYCATCHGREGRGDGFNAYNLDPKPRDLSDPKFQTGRSDDDLLGAVRSGGGAAGLSTAMPPWGRTLNERQIGNIVLFLRTLTPPAE